MLVAKNKIIYTQEWKEIAKLAKESDVSTNKLSPHFDIWLDHKVEWFLFNGAVGVLYLIKSIFGNSGLEEFIKFVLKYMDDENTLGHYHPSANVKTELGKYRESARLFTLNEYLIEIGKNLYENDTKGR
ncbi:hypothetical protein DS834_06685 [Lactobacillus bombicola]|uniref:Uncharacterized protein n=1 Tax=Lactobacillus bombicola TaxID=1505723 RepID=A0ABX9LUM1_9LACO|nr:hypothetical protein [Lactobacillus bombicola]RHW50330.1 hypothetical protein DS834_06685 [Lactobacillus bombicola]